MEIWEGTEQGQDGEATRRMIKVCGMALCDSRSAELEPMGRNPIEEDEDSPWLLVTDGGLRGDRGGGCRTGVGKESGDGGGQRLSNEEPPCCLHCVHCLHETQF